MKEKWEDSWKAKKEKMSTAWLWGYLVGIVTDLSRMEEIKNYLSVKQLAIIIDILDERGIWK